MKSQIYCLFLLLMASCGQKQVESVQPESEPELATLMAGDYKVSAYSILGSTEIIRNVPNDSLSIEKVSSTVVKVSFKVKSVRLDSREKEYVTIKKAGKDYYSFDRAEGFSLMVYQYGKIKLVLADTYYTLYFSKL